MGSCARAPDCVQGPECPLPKSPDASSLVLLPALTPLLRLTNGPWGGGSLPLPSSDPPQCGQRLGYPGMRAAQFLPMFLGASSSSQASVLLSCPNQRHGCHLMPLPNPHPCAPPLRKWTAPTQWVRPQTCSDSALSNPTSTSKSSAPALPSDCILNPTCPSTSAMTQSLLLTLSAPLLPAWLEGSC